MVHNAQLHRLVVRLQVRWQLFVVPDFGPLLAGEIEDLLDIGIPANDIARLGGKTTPKTAPLSLYDQVRTSYRRSTEDWEALRSFERVATNVKDVLKVSLPSIKVDHNKKTASYKSLRELFEFDEEDEQVATMRSAFEVSFIP